MVEVAVQAAALGAGGPGRRVDPHRGHRRQVDDQAVVADPMAGHRVAAAPNRGRQVALAGEPHRLQHVRHPHAAHDRRGRRSTSPFQTRLASS
jgi:hypothetical protein